MTDSRALLVLTSHADLGGVRSTGFYVPEAAEPWRVFTDAGYTVDLASVAGGTPPQDGRDDDDPTQRAFLNDPHIAAQLRHTRALAEVEAANYRIVYFVGGHGTMWDFPVSPDVARIGRQVYEAGGVVAAVCHGPAALLSVTLIDGKPLIAGKRVTGFTNQEEAAVGLTDAVPFLLADALTGKGATHIAGASFTENVVVDGRLVTGQNPQSAAGVARAALAAAQPRKGTPLMTDPHLTHRLGALQVAPIGFGCMGLSQGYGPADDAESIAAVRAALDAGTTLFDTAMSYGQGHNETLLGQALRTVPREAVQIATKFGIRRDGNGVRLDAHPDRVAGWCEDSLRRLGVDHIDLYYLHRVDPAIPIEDTVGAMAALVAQGKVRHLGVSEVTAGQLRRAAAVHPIAAVQLEWSLMWREPELDVVPAARELGVGLVPYSPLGRGLLGGALGADTVPSSPFRASDPRFTGDHLTANLAQVTALAELAASWGVTPAQAALAWLLAQGDDVVPIPGSRKPARARENSAAAALRLDSSRLAALSAAVPASRWVGDRQSFAVPVTTRTTPNTQ